MKTIKAFISLGLAAALGLVAYTAVPSKIQARSTAAFIGNARYGSQAHCFFEGAGGPVQQFCSGAIEWVIPIVYDNAHNATIRVTARGAVNGTHNVTCRAYSATDAGVLTVGSEAKTVRNDGQTEWLTPSVYAHGFGGTWVTCAMDQYTGLFNVHY